MKLIKLGIEYCKIQKHENNWENLIHGRKRKKRHTSFIYYCFYEIITGFKKKNFVVVVKIRISNINYWLFEKYFKSVRKTYKRRTTTGAKILQLNGSRQRPGCSNNLLCGSSWLYGLHRFSILGSSIPLYNGTLKYWWYVSLSLTDFLIYICIY